MEKLVLIDGNSILYRAFYATPYFATKTGVQTNAVYDDNDVFVIGGASVYKLLLPYCEKVLLTKVDADGNADVFFPNLDENSDFYLESESEPILDNGYKIRFTTYKRR